MSGSRRWWRLLAVLGALALGPRAGAEEGAGPAGGLEQEKARGKEYLDAAAQEDGAVRTKSGMVYIPIQVGTGLRPWPTNVVRVNYTGKLVDGKVFDSSVARGRPAEFSLKEVIKCWTEGMQLMKAGGKARLICPPELAYGDQKAGGSIPAGATLDFEVELVEVVNR
jgi:FKBP-type peptidyl-prolyl cis-trans isomerase FkpA